MILCRAAAFAALSVALCAHAGEQASQVFGSVAPSVYSVIADGSGGTMLGSGVVVAPERIATNFHVINGADRIRERRGTDESDAVLLGSDKAHDLALLQVTGMTTAPVHLAPPGTARVGQTVFAIGSPRGLELSLSEGLVSSLRESADGNTIQTTAPISPGSSGGGLFDEQGRLLGFTTAQVSNGQNLNFAVPVEWLRFVGLGTELAAASTGPAVNLPGQALPAAAAPTAPTVLETAINPPAPKAAPSPARTPGLYIASGLIVLVLLMAKPAINWLSDYMSTDTLPTPRVARVQRGTPAQPKDRLEPFRAQLREELKSGQRDAQVWSEALRQCGGDEFRAAVAYVELRAQALLRADMDRRWKEQSGTVQRQPSGR